MVKKHINDAYYMAIAEQVSEHGTCDRAKVGCVLVKDDFVLMAAGYNTSIDSHATCDDAGHYMHEGHCIRTIHAEMNAIFDAMKKGYSVEECVAYVTHRPCPTCTKHLNQAGIKEVVYKHNYRETEQHKAFEDGMILTPFSG